MNTFDKKSDVVATSSERTFAVWVAVRHTRSGDKRIGVYDHRETAMQVADEVASRAAADYGHGSASVFGAALILNSEAEQE